MPDNISWNAPLSESELGSIIRYLNDDNVDILDTRIVDEIELMEATGIDPAILADSIMEKMRRWGSPIFGKDSGPEDNSQFPDFRWLKCVVIQIRNEIRKKLNMQIVGEPEAELWVFEAPELENRKAANAYLKNLGAEAKLDEIPEFSEFQIDEIRKYLCNKYPSVLNYIKIMKEHNRISASEDGRVYSRTALNYLLDSIYGALGLQYSAKLLILRDVYDKI